MRAKLWTFWAAAICLSLVCAVQARAQTDPATLHTGTGQGTACQQGCAGDPNQIGSGGTVDIYQTSNGAGANLVSPILVIIAVPNDTTGTGAYLPTNVQFFNPYNSASPVAGVAAPETGGNFGLRAASNPATGYFGTMTSGDVYTFLGLGSSITNSENFTNLTGADSSIDGVTATSYGIYVFALSGGTVGANGLVNMNFSGLPLGTFVIAYGQNSSGTGFATPFTEAGLTSSGTSTIPEPGSMALFGTGLLVLGGAIRHRLRKQT
jgi:hypothetical protein